MPYSWDKYLGRYPFTEPIKTGDKICLKDAYYVVKDHIFLIDGDATVRLRVLLLEDE